MPSWTLHKLCLMSKWRINFLFQTLRVGWQIAGVQGSSFVWACAVCSKKWRTRRDKFRHRVCTVNTPSTQDLYFCCKTMQSCPPRRAHRYLPMSTSPASFSMEHGDIQQKRPVMYSWKPNILTPVGYLEVIRWIIGIRFLLTSLVLVFSQGTLHRFMRS